MTENWTVYHLTNHAQLSSCSDSKFGLDLLNLCANLHGSNNEPEVMKVIFSIYRVRHRSIYFLPSKRRFCLFRLFTVTCLNILFLTWKTTEQFSVNKLHISRHAIGWSWKLGREKRYYLMEWQFDRGSRDNVKLLLRHVFRNYSSSLK